MPVTKKNKPYVSPKGFHRHQCCKCKVIWEHSDSQKGNDDVHYCPKGCRWDDDSSTIIILSRYNGIQPPDIKQ